MNHEPTWKGPLHKRSCTDCFWLLIFIIFLGGWGTVSYYAFKNGRIEKLFHPSDSEGRKCGIDSQVKNKPYLLFFDLTKCAKISPKDRICPTTQVCVSQCPQKNFLFNAGMTDVNRLKKDLICKIDVKLDKINRLDEIKMLIDHEKCARWYLESTSIIGRCFPNKVWDEFVNATITDEALASAKEVVKAVAEVEQFLKKAFESAKENKYIVLAISIISGFVSLFYIVILRWLATPCVWATIFTLCGLLGFATYEASLIYQKNQTTEWLIVLITCAVLCTVIVLVTLFLRKRIHLACQLIKESSKAVTCILSSLFFPLVPWLLHLLVLAYGVTIFLYLSTVWKPNYRVDMMNDDCSCEPSLRYVANSSCDPDLFNAKCVQRSTGEPCTLSACNLLKKDRPWFINHFHVVNIIGFYWLFFFVSAFGEMVLAATFATWYWTFRKRDVPYFTITVGLYRTIRYHLGTLAFGSLILTICRLIRLILEVINNKVKKANNQVANAIMCCCRCFFYLLENFLRFVNSNAYIMCAVYGKGFCSSARDAFNLLMRNVVRVVVINKITSWLLLLGKLLISALTVAATWWYYTNSSASKAGCKDDVSCWAVPVAMTAIASYLIATVFFKVHAAAIDTLFLCFLEDCERNDGSKERPYFMSKRLRRLLHK
ncbi:CTL-like protein 2 [Copidosoma floridanum]|uniref:CTL-like protein 2 n=1 Tax=Copidosoma floridanum TaxID=29053 RepID=UPI0006C99517|nr:CTL-like protein 2 [Copidosoma floridanum]XP_014210999.1 CTL-like protein 2 [Copidosoma floridanum]XP_014211000.1 CTL-like protein 2 [Copidosoma floridanum]XP_014211001.1 CTL-like protein 2 [Copidosoma floridanum]